VVAEEEESAAVVVVPSVPRSHIDSSRCCQSGAQIKVDSRDLEFLDDFLREIEKLLHSLGHKLDRRPSWSAFVQQEHSSPIRRIAGRSIPQMVRPDAGFKNSES
jgi:hypothetical protein